MNKQIRWQQRFQNFEKALIQLDNAVKIEKPSDTERAGLIQFFEVCFELAWKTLKDYLESQGFGVKTPMETLKQSFQINLIEDGHAWMQAMDDRNLTTHTYDEEASRKIEDIIKRKYFPLLKTLRETLTKKKKP